MFLCLCCSSLKKHNLAISSLIRRETTSFNKELTELLSALFDFLRQILNSEAMVGRQQNQYICACMHACIW